MYKKKVKTFLHITKINAKKKVFQTTREREDSFLVLFFSLLEVVLLCTCVVLHLHIEGVLSKRALAGKGWGGGGGQYDGLRSKGRRSDGGQ